MDNIPSGLFSQILTGLLTGTLLSTVLGFVFYRWTIRVQQDIQDEYEKSLAIFQSQLSWEVKAISELLAPMYMQLDRTSRAFLRWQSKNLYLEAKVIRDANLTIRDLLLTKSHLIPPKLLDDAGKLVEHYDRWLEEFDKLRGANKPSLDESFIFTGPQGFPFPRESESRFRAAFKDMWNDLYGQRRKINVKDSKQ